ncbi:SGNH/GDSL hydrolase family protein [Nocardioides sp.]|uniref:SGNH/GDSL hydrolase family protein n=1 Tax=Nocardioides sp. TaxID=35761 RepID=UPI0035B322AC
MRIVLLGDSHLARVRRDLPVVGQDVRNAAVGGATSLDLLAQADGAMVTQDDLVVVSVGTNDAAPWKWIPVTTFAQALLGCMESMPARRWVCVAPPGVEESRLSGSGDRTNAVLDRYREAAGSACVQAGAHLLRTDQVIAPLGADAFAGDGVHLSGRGYEVVLPAIAEAVRGGA